MNQPLIAHITDVQLYKRCRRLWKWQSRYQTGLSPRQPQGPLFIGRVVHRASEEYVSEGTPMLRAMALALREELGSVKTDPAWPIMRSAVRADTKMIRSLLDQYAFYLQESAGPFGEDKLEPLAHEMRFGPQSEEEEGAEPDFPPVLLQVGGVPLEPHVYVAGRFDGLVRRKRDGTVWLTELKTCRDIEERAALLQHDEQATIYCYAAQELFGEPIAGVIYTLLRKKIPQRPRVLKNGTLSQDKRIDTTYATYLDTIRRHHGEIGEGTIQRLYGDFLSHLRNYAESYVARVAIERPPRQIDAFVRELHATVLEMYDPRTPLYANRTFACPGCSFRQPCLAKDRGDDDRLSMLLKTAYRTKEVPA